MFTSCTQILHDATFIENYGCSGPLVSRHPVTPFSCFAKQGPLWSAEQVTGGVGADVTLDAAGVAATCENAVWCTRRGGRSSAAFHAVPTCTAHRSSIYEPYRRSMKIMYYIYKQMYTVHLHIVLHLLQGSAQCVTNYDCVLELKIQDITQMIFSWPLLH